MLQLAGFLKILSPLVCLMYLDTIVDSMLKGLDKQLSVMGVNILDLFVSISSIYFLLPIFGMNGYLMVIFISEILNTSISIFQLRKTNPFHISLKKSLIIPSLGVMLSYIVTTMLNVTVNSVILSILIYALFYVGFLFFANKVVRSKGLVNTNV